MGAAPAVPPQTPLQSGFLMLKHLPSQPLSRFAPLQTPQSSTFALPPHTCCVRRENSSGRRSSCLTQSTS